MVVYMLSIPGTITATKTDFRHRAWRTRSAFPPFVVPIKHKISLYLREFKQGNKNGRDGAVGAWQRRVSSTLS